MSRRPLSNEQLTALFPGRSDKTLNGSASHRTNLLEEPSSPSSPGVPKKRTPKEFKWDRKPLAEVRAYGEQIVKGLWEAKGADDLVGLYAVLHEHVFGVLPLELQQEFLMARASADKLVREEFAGDYLEAQRFVAWCWKSLVKSRKKNPDSDFRPGWRFQFKARKWLTDYKASGRP